MIWTIFDQLVFYSENYGGKQVVRPTKNRP